MTIADIINRGRVRTDNLWKPFTHDTFMVANNNKGLIFGLYANYEQPGFAYLVEISEERLLQLVAQYENSMAQLNNEEQKVIIDLAAKRYSESLTQLIHEQDMLTGKKKVDAQDLEYDAKFAALDADRKAIETKQEQLNQEIIKAHAKIERLEAQISEEKVRQEFVNAEITQKQLDETRVRLRILQAENKGLMLQYDIADMAVKKVNLELERQKTQQSLTWVEADVDELEAQDANMDADIIKSNTKRAMVDVDVAQMNVRSIETELKAVNKEIDAELIDADIAKAKIDVAMVDVDIAKTQAQTAREQNRKVEIETDIALLDVRIVELQLDADEVIAKVKNLEADLVEIDARIIRESISAINLQIATIRKQNLEFEIPAKKDRQLQAIAKQIEILVAKIGLLGDLENLENKSFANDQTKQQSKHSLRMALLAMDKELDLLRLEVKIDDLDNDMLIELERRRTQQLEDQERIKEPERRVKAADIARDAAIEAAETMAGANILNELTHTIGRG